MVVACCTFLKRTKFPYINNLNTQVQKCAQYAMPLPCIKILDAAYQNPPEKQKSHFLSRKWLFLSFRTKCFSTQSQNRSGAFPR
jgi:hypothetical protein